MAEYTRFDTDLSAAREGSTPALGTLLESYRGYLRAVAWRQVPQRLHRKVHPSSLAQEAYVRAYRDFDQFRGDSPNQMRQWLRKIMIRCFLNLLRKPEFKRPASELNYETPSDADSPEDRAVANERDGALIDAMAQLPVRYRLVIELHHYERLTFAEIGQTLNCSSEAGERSGFVHSPNWDCS